jgi:hypothetical protein
MDESEKVRLLEKYIASYNAFDIDAMLSVVSKDIKFRNISNGEETASASGKEALRNLAEASKSLFSSRHQTMEYLEINEEKTKVKISFKGVLAADLPNGLKAGHAIELNGRSEFQFKDGKISVIIDIS